MPVLLERQQRHSDMAVSRSQELVVEEVLDFLLVVFDDR